MSKDPIVVWHSQTVTRQQREAVQSHRGRVLWFTGLSGSGKSTIANIVEQLLAEKRTRTILLDGDNLRHGLCATPKILKEGGYSDPVAERFGLGFSPDDREENIRRIGCTAQLFVEAGIVVLTAFVSPYRRDRAKVRKWIEQQGSAGDFIEIFVDTSLEVCESRDPKGMYKLAREGKIAHFTGISDPYEAPESPEVHLKTEGKSPLELAREVLAQVEGRLTL